MRKVTYHCLWVDASGCSKTQKESSSYCFSHMAWNASWICKSFPWMWVQASPSTLYQVCKPSSVEPCNHPQCPTCITFRNVFVLGEWTPGKGTSFANIAMMRIFVSLAGLIIACIEANVPTWSWYLIVYCASFTIEANPAQNTLVSLGIF